jgi:hypothetical protein
VQCHSDEDCSLLGVCSGSSGVCQCDVGWTGADCGQLDLAPAQPNSGLNETASGISSWGANIFPAAEAGGGGGDSWHMLAAEFENKCGISRWSPNSAIVLATSDRGAAGPYKRRKVVVPPFAHNPKVVRAPDGTWLMYTIGVKLPPSELFNCTEAGVAQQQQQQQPGRNPLNRESNISLYTSKALEGPWERFGVVLGPDYEGTWDEDTTNPSPWVLANGTVLLMYRGCVVHQPGCAGEYMGVASAPGWRGPYTRLGKGPILPDVYAEDPSLWLDRRGNFHFLMHYIPDSQRVARHAFARSFTGPWSMHTSSIPYNSTVAFSDGTVVSYEKRERPHIVWGAAGNPQFLVTGVVIPQGQHGYSGRSFTLVQPFRAAADGGNPRIVMDSH